MTKCDQHSVTPQVTEQKIRGGSLAAKSELRLEIAEVALQEVHVDGSLLVNATAIMGQTDSAPGAEPVLTYR